MEKMYAGAMDIGGTKTLVGIVDRNGNIKVQRYIPTYIDSWEKHHLTCVKLLKECLDETGLEEKQLAGIGINAPGIVDSRNGIIHHAPFAGWKNVPVGDFLRQIYSDVDIRLENDVNSCALGELAFGHGIECRNFFWMTVSTGIGGAIVVDGDLIYGSNGYAGEIGHLKVENRAQKICSCGQKGCLEAYASGTAIARRVGELIMKFPSYNKLFEERGLARDGSGGAILAREGDRYFLEIFEKCGAYLGQAISHAVNLLNPEAVILGGGVTKSLDLLLPYIQHQVAKNVVAQARNVSILKTKLGNNAALIGAAAVAFAKK